MLQSIREHIQGWIAAVFIVLIGAAFIFWGVEYYLEQGSGRGAAVAKVNGQKITQQEFNNFYQNLQRSQRINVASLSPEQQRQYKEFAIRGLIANVALLQAAQKAGFTVSMSQVQRLVSAAPQFRENGKFSPKRLQEIVYASGLTPNQFFERLQHSLITNQVTVGLQATAFLLPNELQRAYELIYQKRNIGYFTIPTKRFAAKIQPTEKQIQAYYQQNKQSFMTPAQVQVSYILLSPADLAKNVKVTEKQVQSYYEGNKTNYTIPKRWQIAEILAPLSEGASQVQMTTAKDQIDAVAKKLQGGTSFEQIMKAVPKGLKSSTVWVSQGQANGELAEALKQLKVSDISTPIRTKKGYVIVKLLAVQQQKQRSFESVKAQIQKMLVHQKVQQQLSTMSQSLANLTYTNPSTLEPAAKSLGVKVQQSPLMTRQGEKKGLFSEKKVLAAVFSDNVFKQGDNSSPIELSGGKVLVVRVSKKIPAKQQPLAEVKSKISDALVKQKAGREAGLLAYNIQSEIAKGESVNTIASKHDLQWVTVSNVERTDKKLPKQIVTTAFKLPVAAKGKVSADSVVLSDGDYAVIKLISVAKPDFAAASKDKIAKLEKGLTGFSGQLTYRYYVKTVLDNAKVKINKEVLFKQ